MNASRRYSFLLLSLTFFVCLEPVQAANGIENMRIFYTAEERNRKDADVDGTTSSPAIESKINDDIESLTELNEVEAVVSAEPEFVRGSPLIFDAIVRLKDRYVVVVNSLPCRTENDQTSPQQLFVLCAHNDHSDLRLVVSTVTAQLDVYHGANKLATLSVGESL